MLFESGQEKWQTIKLKSNNRKLTSTHSIYELYIAWKELGGEKGLNQETLELLEYYIENINKYDEDSTFFRYPIDKEGNRIGYGKGYYDRYLSRFDIHRVGFCFEKLFVDSLPHGRFDAACDAVITERGVFYPDENK